MRADNSRHIIAAARHRTDQTRQRAIAALRRMDATGNLSTSTASPAKPASHVPGATPKTTCAARSNGSANTTGPRGTRRFPTGNAQPATPCCGAWRQPPTASASYVKRTRNSARH